MKTVFITGAGRGIGLATARLYAAQGWFVGLYDIDREALQGLLQSGDFPNACGDFCDVTDRASVDAALEHFAQQSGGRLDVLVNNAGVLSSGRFEELDPGAHERMIAVNVGGLTHVAQAGFALLRDTPDSALVNLCSASSIHGIPMLAVYSATKFYVNGLTEALAIEWAAHDIRVSSIKPPVVDTAMGHQLDSSLTEKMGINTTAGEVAEAVLQAAAGRRVSHVLGGTTRLWYRLDRWLPERGRLALTRYLTSQ